MSLGFALLGCGRISTRHAQLLGGGSIHGATLEAVCDLQDQRCRKLGEKHDVPWFTDMHEMMMAVGDRIDVVSILTESGNHAEHVLALAPYRKHLVVEKPMALALDHADSMIRACDEHKIKLFIVKQNRFNVPVIKLRQAMEQGRFGKLVLGTVRVRWCRTQQYYDQDAWRGTWALDGGVLANQANHHIDLLEWMMGDVESVFAKSSTALCKIEVEDTAVVLLRFRNGALGIIEATTATRPLDLEGSLSILGERGSVEIGGFAVNQLKVWNFVDEQEGDREAFSRFSENPPNVYGFGHQRYYEHVVSCINNETHQLVDGFEGRRILALIRAIYESIETGNEVYLRNSPKRCKLGIVWHSGRGILPGEP